MPSLSAAHRFAQLVSRRKPSCAGSPDREKLAGRNALHRIHDNADRAKQIGEATFCVSEDGPARHRELVTAFLGGALELAARRNLVVIQRAATRADRLAIRLMPAQLAERLVSLVPRRPDRCALRLSVRAAAERRKCCAICHHIRWCLPSDVDDRHSRMQGYISSKCDDIYEASLWPANSYKDKPCYAGIRGRRRRTS